MDKPLQISMEDAFTFAKNIQSQDDQYGYCHVLEHKLSAKELNKDIQNGKI